VDFGVFLPISGRAAGAEALTRAARQAERLGFDAVWSAERVVMPWQIKTPYPYSEGSEFIVPPDRPFLDSMSCLAYLAGRTKRIRLGISVLVLPYRHPLYWARVAATVDRLSAGRFVLGVGCGWMEEEFAAQGVDFASRGRATDEQLEIAQLLWRDERISYEGRYYAFSDVAFYPKATGSLTMPTWVGGESRAARRRAGRFGDAWFPYFVSITPDELGRLFQEVREMAVDSGRKSEDVALAVCRPIEVTTKPQPQDSTRLRGTPDQLIEALAGYREIGVSHMALQFTAARFPERLKQIQRFGREVLSQAA
jgi:probable F420-dependent oxidoreductase